MSPLYSLELFQKRLSATISSYPKEFTRF
jgi:hypothetical protein